MTLPGWTRSRWVIVPGFLAIVVGLWNIHVATHDNGIVEGRVVDASGRPVPGASVVLFERSFVTHTEKARTTSDTAGSFRFTGNRNHSIQLEAESSPLGRSDRRLVRLWFRAQDVRLAEPLRFAARLP